MAVYSANAVIEGAVRAEGSGVRAGRVLRMAVPAALLAALVLFSAPVPSAAESGETVLRAYGPGGPHHAVSECAELFRERYGITVGVIKASPLELSRRLKEDGDVYFTGAEYMLDDFAEEYSDIIDAATVVALHPRQVGIVVRKGNPHGIMGVECLGKKGIVLMAANLEEMEPFLSPDGTDAAKVSMRVHTGREGVKAWREQGRIDAWLTYRSWHHELKDEAEFVEIPWDQARRHTMAAITLGTPNREAALQFLEFLQSPEARDIFVKHGWD